MTPAYLCLSTVFLLVAYFPFQGSSLECYVCDSDNDPRCGDPFSNYTIGKLDCSLRIPPDHLKAENRESKVCRKIVQSVQGHKRVIRTCGYLTDELRDNRECQRRSGTHEVTLYYCSCTGGLCNSAPDADKSYFLLTSAILAAITATL